MQQFNDNKGERRILNIKKMLREDIGDYYLQHLQLSKKERYLRETELRNRISQSTKKDFYEWILAIKSKQGKILGKIEVYDMGNNTAFVTINLPNESLKIKYGEEALDQFIKICEENKYFSKIELEKNNSIVERYITNHKLGYEIEVA